MSAQTWYGPLQWSALRMLRDAVTTKMLPFGWVKGVSNAKLSATPPGCVMLTTTPPGSVVLAATPAGCLILVATPPGSVMLAVIFCQGPFGS